MSQAAVEHREGERIGPYRLDNPIGSGGMGTVWRAWDERLRRHVAIKQVRRDSAKHRERLRREARTAARLSHPAIVHVYDLVEGDATDWIVMELVSGQNLRQLLDREGHLAVGQALQLGREVAEGLAEAHAHGILHRDLKAANIMVTASGHAKILDFGLSKQLHEEGGGAADGDPSLSVTGALIGTCFAMSPEQVEGLPLDLRSDLFSFGSLFYEALTGSPPFRGEGTTESLMRVLRFWPQPLYEVRPDVPLGLSRLIDRLLEKDRLNRPASAGEVSEILASLAARHSFESPGPEKGSAAPGGVAGSAESAATETFAEKPPREVRREPFDSAVESPTLVDSQLERDSRGSGSGSAVAGERRTVTVVCCSLVRAEAGGPLDLELLSDSMVTFEEIARTVCRELSGHLGAVLSHMLWIYFGYPTGHEDDALRAVRAARELRARARQGGLLDRGLALRCGIHTGPAVVWTRPGRQDRLQLGSTLDLAMGIQGAAPLNSIAVSTLSRRLLTRGFATRPLPPAHLPDVDGPVEIYEIGEPLEAQQQDSSPVAPLVNRDAELQILLDRFRLACSGSGQAVFIAGEAGIGKSRLVWALSEQTAADAPTWLIAHGSTFTQNTPLAPIVQLMERSLFAGESSAEGPAEEKLRRLEEILDEHSLPRPDYAPLLGALLSLPTEERYPPLVLSPEARRKRTLAAILALLGSMAERHPVVLVIEDLHWVDPSTLELLDLLLSEIAALPLLLVATFRPEFTAPLRHQTAVTQLGLSGLSESHATQLVRQVAEGKGLPAEMHREIVVRTDGNPLFVEELTKAVLEGDAPLREPSGVPFTLGASLLARLDRLGEAKAVAQLAAVLGRTFSLELLEALSWIKGAALQGAISRLVQAEILYRRGPAAQARYIFKHALIQDAAYLSLLASDRQQLHRRLAGLLEEEFPAVAEAEPELMAHHCERGGLTMEAIEFLQQAGNRALQRSAQHEALSHLSRALDLLLGLPPAPDLLRLEFELRGELGPCLAAVKSWGAPEVAANAERWTALCRELGNHERLLASIYGMWTHHILRGDRQPSFDLAEELTRLAETPVQVFIGYSAKICSCHYGGRFAEVLALAEQAARLFEPNLLPDFTQVFGEPSTLVPIVCELWALWIVGRPDAADRRRNAMLATVEALRMPPFPVAYALLFDLILWHELREVEQVDRVSSRLIALAKEQDFPFFLSLANCAQGWVACQRGDLAGMAQTQAGLDLQDALGAKLPRGYYLTYLIESQLMAGRISEGLAAIREALTRSETQLDVFYDAEIHRLQGELLRASGDAGAAEASLKKALEVAREQGAGSFELRAATSLGRLLAEQGRAGEALPVLTAAYQAFSEGFATRDLTEARELLDRLASLQILAARETS